LIVTKTANVSAPVLCRHCEEAFCALVCPVNAIARDAEAERVAVDEKSCIGCKMCALACPFGAITPSGTTTAGVAGIRTNTPTHPAALNPLLVWEIGVRTVAVKCDLCAFDAEGPACVRACPTKGLVLIDDETIRLSKINRKKSNARQGSGMSIDAALALFKGR
jgi:hydrogenase-4 component A